MTAIYYNDAGAAGAAGGGKDDKWFFEARTNKGKLEFNPEGMTEEQALKEMGRGKNIITVKEKFAQRLVKRYNGDPITKKVDFVIDGVGKEKFYEHANYNAKGMRLHCWIWRP